MAKKIDFSKMPIKVVGVGAGVTAGLFLRSKLPNQNAYLVGGGEIVLGALIPSFLPKNEIAENFGNGLIAAGSSIILKRVAPSIVAGVDDDDNSQVNAIAASQQEQITNEYLMSGLGVVEPQNANDGLGTTELNDGLGATESNEGLGETDPNAGLGSLYGDEEK